MPWVWSTCVKCVCCEGCVHLPPPLPNLWEYKLAFCIIAHHIALLWFRGGERIKCYIPMPSSSSINVSAFLTTSLFFCASLGERWRCKHGNRSSCSTRTSVRFVAWCFFHHTLRSCSRYHVSLSLHLTFTWCRGRACGCTRTRTLREDEAAWPAAGELQWALSMFPCQAATSCLSAQCWKIFYGHAALPTDVTYSCCVLASAVCHSLASEIFSCVLKNFGCVYTWMHIPELFSSFCSFSTLEAKGTICVKSFSAWREITRYVAISCHFCIELGWLISLMLQDTWHNLQISVMCCWFEQQQ